MRKNCDPSKESKREHLRILSTKVQQEDKHEKKEKLPEKFTPNCEALIREDEHELLRIKKYQSSNKIDSLSLPDGAISSFIHSKGCSEFVNSRNYRFLSSNADFPLAYSLVLHKNPGQAERLLRAIYSPDNVYCLHIDAKAPEDVFEDFEALASCFPNVFLAKKRESVYWASYERLQADLNCIEELLQHEVQWRYLINLCGEDFPLKSNSEIVNYLKSLYPRNSIESYSMSLAWNSKKKKRYEKHWELRQYYSDKSEYSLHPRMTDQDKIPPPGDIEIFSGMAYNFFTREFIEWAREDEEVGELIEWSKDSFSPDEFIWATILRMKNAPGNEFVGKTPYLARLVLWENNAKNHRCRGYYRRGICVFGSGDVGWLLKSPYFFANKFDAVDDFALQCLEEELRKRD
ncbi:Oidioi.mRNA.OKI2018_I69.chr1.g917.t1.cds [Oikopleura dioica]|uniref:Oidioi.mRNA.OKI2018_I69.chr1.g917.t1.cds n=1 Tax=Oikopleura dioica TaxID=34765 RepID=A0ABN7SRC6_OIKDI|nr:Oidioi.mRNA.OKI2018_I69.chr1.g917.t1.cds [Oikopleura dioica]